MASGDAKYIKTYKSIFGAARLLATTQKLFTHILVEVQLCDKFMSCYDLPSLSSFAVSCSKSFAVAVAVVASLTGQRSEVSVDELLDGMICISKHRHLGVYSIGE